MRLQSGMAGQQAGSFGAAFGQQGQSGGSRQGLWEYVFFIDIDGHREDADVAKALSALQGNVKLLKILGSYPKAVI